MRNLILNVTKSIPAIFIFNLVQNLLNENYPAESIPGQIAIEVMATMAAYATRELVLAAEKGMQICQKRRQLTAANNLSSAFENAKNAYDQLKDLGWEKSFGYENAVKILPLTHLASTNNSYQTFARAALQSDYDVLLRLGDVCLKAEKNDEAMQFYQFVVPNEKNSYYFKAQIKMKLAENNFGNNSQEELQQALSDLDKKQLKTWCKEYASLIDNLSQNFQQTSLKAR